MKSSNELDLCLESRLGRARLPAQMLARWALSAFLATFMVARCVVFLIMSQRLPDLYLFIGQTHVHHLNYGIFLLAAVGAALLFWPLRGRGMTIAAVAYGIGLALTFDEFGMWLHLQDVYWQRASYDAVAVIAALLGLIVAAPRIRQWSPRQWLVLVGIAVIVALFALLLMESVQMAERRAATRRSHSQHEPD